MSIIECNITSNSMLIEEYKRILQDKINEVCKKICFDDSEVCWCIFDPKEGKNSVEKLFVGNHGADYGKTNIFEKKIYISVLAIQRRKSDAVINIEKIVKFGIKQRDILVDVIIDEITHIQTQKNHGDVEYDEKFDENLKKFYLGFF